MKKLAFCILAFIIFINLAFTGCSSNVDGPEKVLNKYFSSAQKQDYATSYTCYYKDYQKKVTKNEFIKHRKEASVIQSYKILELKTNKNLAHATVELTFAPSEKLKRPTPVTVKVKEDLVKEKDGWKIKVW